jgi:hypothetical protein
MKNGKENEERKKEKIKQNCDVKILNLSLPFLYVL